MNEGSFKITVLGQEYTVEEHHEDSDPKFNECNGYFEPYSKKIVINSDLIANTNKDPMGAENMEIRVKHIYRHEILHAFFEESGISYRYSTEDEDFLVDWISTMYPKMKKIFEELDIEE